MRSETIGLNAVRSLPNNVPWDRSREDTAKAVQQATELLQPSQHINSTAMLVNLRQCMQHIAPHISAASATRRKRQSDNTARATNVQHVCCACDSMGLQT